MAYCGKCGAKLDDEQYLCDICGADNRLSEMEQLRVCCSEVMQGFPYIKDEDRFLELTMCIVLVAQTSYIGPMSLSVFSVAKRLPYTWYHWKQGFTLFVLEVLIFTAGITVTYNASFPWRLGVFCGITAGSWSEVVHFKCSRKFPKNLLN